MSLERWIRLIAGGSQRVTRTRSALGLAVVLLLSGCDGERAAEVPGAGPAPVADVRVEAVALAAVQDAVDATGTVRTKTQMLIAAKVAGYVREVRVRLGDHVEPGALLVTVDDREFAARAARARAALAEAELGLDEVQKTLEEAAAALRSAEADRAYADATAARYRQLWQRELISAQDFEAVEAKRKSSAAAVDEAQARSRSLQAREAQMRHRIVQAQAERRIADLALSDTRLTAPATAVVVARRVEPGDMAGPGQPLLVLEDPRAYRLEAEVGESSMARLRQPVPVVLDALGQTLEGRVVEVVPAADPASRTVTVKIDLPPHPALRSGLFGRARFPTGERQALLVPAAALVERGQLTGLYVVDGQGVARLRLVTVGARQAGRVEILSGLDAGERIVVEGADRVSDGVRVAAGP
jgi:multidrug efflux pump subunit AcrA (membrane-fusion protein)